MLHEKASDISSAPRVPPAIRRAQDALVDHPLAGLLAGRRAWAIFMTHHVFAVWDFMNLVKRLQRELTCLELPWRPPDSPRASRLVNEIVLAEESDEDGLGGVTSHFELYLLAMDEMGADPSPARAFVAELGRGVAVERALSRPAVPEAARPFVAATYRLAARAPREAVAGAFLWDRESVLPMLFARLLAALRRAERPAPSLERYLARHIEMDGQEHGPAAHALVASLCPDAAARRRSVAAGRAALERRLSLWSAVAAAIQKA